MGVTAKINVNLGGVHEKISSQAFRKGQIAMANQMGADMNQFVPRKSNALRRSQVIAPDGSSISWNTVYAARQFTAPPGWKYTTPGTGPRWNRRGGEAFRNSWKKAFIKGAGID